MEGAGTELAKYQLGQKTILAHKDYLKYASSDLNSFTILFYAHFPSKQFESLSLPFVNQLSFLYYHPFVDSQSAGGYGLRIVSHKFEVYGAHA